MVAWSHRKAITIKVVSYVTITLMSVTTCPISGRQRNLAQVALQRSGTQIHVDANAKFAAVLAKVATGQTARFRTIVVCMCA